VDGEGEEEGPLEVGELGKGGALGLDGKW